MAAAGPPKRR